MTIPRMKLPLSRSLYHRLIVVLLCALSNATARAHPTSWVFVSLLEEKKIVVYARDPLRGVLTRTAEFSCPEQPAFLTASPDGTKLYGAYRSTGQLASFLIDGTHGTLRQISVVNGGDDPAYLVTDRAGRFLLSAYYRANKVCVHRLRADGSIDDKLVQTIPTAEKAHGIALTSNERFVFVPHTGANRIYQFRFDSATGKLTPNDPPYVTTPDHEHPRHIALHPSGQWAYVSNEAGDSVGVYFTAREAGTLKPIQSLPSIPAGFDGARNATARCEIAPNGMSVYIANRGHDSIACYAIDQKTGRVRLLEFAPTEKTPRSFTIDRSGQHLYAAGQNSGRIAAYKIRADGSLDRFATYDVGSVPWWVLVVDTARPSTN